MTDADQMAVWLREAMGTAGRLAEAAAKEAGGADWEYQERGSLDATGPSGSMVAVGSQDYLDPAPGKFMAANDPAAVLRRIAADRKTLDWHTSAHTTDGQFCYECGGPCTHKGEAECQACGMNPCNTLVWLAEGYGWKGDQ